jgi:hypothetical protein
MAYLSPWVETEARLPDEDQEVLAKCWNMEGCDRFYMHSCIFKKEYGVHKNAFVIQEYPYRMESGGEFVASDDGCVIQGVMCWMPIPQHEDFNSEERVD